LSFAHLDPLQPRPIQTLVVCMDVGGGTVTGIARVWKKGDPARCRLCPECAAADDVCMLMVNKPVAEADAPLFSLEDFHSDDNPRRLDLFGRSSLN
jgi:hypothetical protein